MIPKALRAFFACASVACFYGGVAGLVIASNPLYLIALFASALLVVPAMFGGERPSELDLPRIEEHLQRFRNAMLVTFTATAAVYGTVITGRGRMSWALLQQLGALGVALWLVAFVLMFFVAYYGKQRRLATR